MKKTTTSKLTNDDLLKNKTKENINLLLEKNNDLIIRIAKKYKRLIYTTPVITIEDLIQTARFSFYEAAMNYNPDIHQSKFAAYAYNNVLNSLNDVAATFRCICKIPKEKEVLLRKIEDYCSKYQNVNGKKPTIKELCDEFNQKEGTIKKLFKLSQRNIISLNTISYATDEEVYEMIDTIPIKKQNPAEIYEDKNTIESVKHLIENSNLSDNERVLLSELFGLFGQEKLTYEEIGKKHNISSQAISQKQKRILRVLRDNEEINNYACIIGMDPTTREDLGKGEMKKPRFTVYHNLFERYPNYSKEELIEAVKRLPENQKKIIYKRYGNDLSSREANEKLTKDEQNTLKNTIYTTIQKYLDNPKYEYKPTQELNLLRKFKNYHKGEIVKAIEKLSSVYQDVIYLRYGENLDEINPMPSEILSIINLTIIPEIRSIMKERREELDKDYCSRLTYKENIDYSKLIEVIEFDSFKEYLNILSEYERNILLSIIKEEQQLEDVNVNEFIARKTLADLIYGYYQYLKCKNKETKKDRKVLEKIISRILY